MTKAPHHADASRQSMIDTIHHSLQYHYPHLQAQFIPDFCMQVKLSLPRVKQSLLKTTPQAVINILREQGIQPEHASHQATPSHLTNQFLLGRTHPAQNAGAFVLKAALGPNFISFWFRNQSGADNLDKPLLAALEIIDRISQRISELQHSTSDTDSPDHQQPINGEASKTA